MTLAPKIWAWEELQGDPSWFKKWSIEQLMVWQATLPRDPEIEAQLVDHLSSAERMRLGTYLQREDQRRFLAGRGLLRLLLAAHLDIPAGLIEFDCGPFGKPCLAARKGAPALHFNVSHSGKLVVLAFSSLYEVGVDVEEMRCHDDLPALARQVFSVEEYADWRQQNAEGQLSAFYKKWTRQEAGLKATGAGFTGESKFETNNSLTFFDLTLPAGYEGAVALVT